MIINGDQILYRLKCGDIEIDPFEEKYLGTNSYDVRLGKVLKVPTEQIIDIRRPETIQYREIDLENGQYMLEKGQFVLGSTLEFCKNNARDLVPMIEGRSTVGRCGLSVHETAGFGDIRFCGNWTLEITPKIPIVLYYGMPIAQIYWVKTEPTLREYKGRYQNQIGTTSPRTEKERQ